MLQDADVPSVLKERVDLKLFELDNMALWRRADLWNLERLFNVVPLWRVNELLRDLLQMKVKQF